MFSSKNLSFKIKIIVLIKIKKNNTGPLTSIELKSSQSNYENVSYIYKQKNFIIIMKMENFIFKALL